MRFQFRKSVYVYNKLYTWLKAASITLKKRCLSLYKPTFYIRFFSSPFFFPFLFLYKYLYSKMDKYGYPISERSQDDQEEGSYQQSSYSKVCAKQCYTF